MIILCPKCHTAYDKNATYCNKCDIDLSEENLIENVIEKNKKAKLFKFIAIILFLFSLPSLLFGFSIVGNEINIPIGLIIGLILLFSSYYIMRISNSLDMLSGEELIESDPRKPILYLRAFKRDSTILASPFEIIFRTYLFPTPSILMTYEEKLVEELSFFGPVISIRNPKNKFNNLGSAPISATDDTWRSKVNNLSKKSKYIAIMLDSSPGILWEIENLTKNNNLTKIIFLIPFLRGAKYTEFTLEYEELQKKFKFLPNIDYKTGAIVFTKNRNHTQLIQAKSNDGRKKIDAIFETLKAIEIE